MIPGRILGSCDLIRQIRNEFAHHPDKKQLSDLDNKKHLQKLAAQLTGFNRAMGDGASHAEMFKVLVSDVLVALRVYIQHVGRASISVQRRSARALRSGRRGSNRSTRVTRHFV